MMDTHRAIVLQDHLPGFAGWLGWVILVIELFAVAILLVGLARFAWGYLRSELAGSDMIARTTRANLGRIVLARYILMALEVFIVADLLMTLLSASLESLMFLALLVLVRSVISWFLEHEISKLTAEARRLEPEDRPPGDAAG